MRSSSSSTASCSAGLVAALLLLLPGPAAAQLDDDSGDDAALWVAASAREGRGLFRAVCAGCHGARGDGKSRVAVALFPPPRDLTRGEYRFRSTASGRLPTRADMLRTLSFGLPGTVMPAWGDQLDARQLRSLVLYLETLSPRFAAEGRDDDVIVDPEMIDVPEATPESLARGRKVYEESKCGECHGPLGRGDGTASTVQKNSDGSPAHVFDFTYGVYKGGGAPLDVYRTFTTGLTGTPMPAFDQALPKEEDRWALVHYVLSLSREPGLWFYLSERPTWREPVAAPSTYISPEGNETGRTEE